MVRLQEAENQIIIDFLGYSRGGRMMPTYDFPLSRTR
jgi:hypothetical protein